MTDDRVHRTQLVVRGYHVDLYGHVNNARYLEFLEEARWRLIEDLDLEALAAQGRGFVAARIDINFRRPARPGDRLEIRSFLTRLGGKSAVVRQEVHFADREADTLVAAADVTFVVVDTRTRRAVALEGEVRELFARYLIEA